MSGAPTRSSRCSLSRCSFCFAPSWLGLPYPTGVGPDRNRSRRIWRASHRLRPTRPLRGHREPGWSADFQGVDRGNNDRRFTDQSHHGLHRRPRVFYVVRLLRRGQGTVGRRRRSRPSPLPGGAQPGNRLPPQAYPLVEITVVGLTPRDGIRTTVPRNRVAVGRSLAPGKRRCCVFFVIER